MIIVSQLFGGLVGIHLLWLYFFLTGTLIRDNRSLLLARDKAGDQGRRYMSDLVITTTTGITITGFVLLLLGFLGLLSASALLLWLGLEVLLFKVVKQESVFGGAFWISRLHSIKQAWSLPALIIYFGFLIISVPAILPPTLWDSVSYHLAYAVDWANAGRIYVDEFLRFPYYANNFLLIYTLLFVLKLGHLCHFMTWLCGLLTGLGVYALISETVSGQTDAGQQWRFCVALKNTIVPLTLVLSPVFLRYIDVGYVDIPIGLFILIPILCTYLVLGGSTQNYEVDITLTAAFCVGMKISLFLCLPLFVFSLILIVRRQRKKTAYAMTLCALLLLLSAPWYVRNFIAAGDPIAPALNLLLRGRDPIFTAPDYAALKSDIQPPRNVSALLLLPIKLFSQPESPSFREYGTNFSVTLLYLPFVTALLLWSKSFRKRVGAGFIYLNVAVIYLLGNWLGISSLARYSLQLLPVYVGYLGVCCNLLLPYLQTTTADKKVLRQALLVLLILLLLLLLYPSPASENFYEDNVQSNYWDVAEKLENRQLFFRRNLPGYVSAQTIITSMYAKGDQHKRALVLGFENLSFYFRKRNIVSVGDWFGPGRYADLASAVDNSDLAAYLTKFEIDAVLVNLGDKRIGEPQYQSFIKQLELNHFTLQPKIEARAAVYLKNK